MLMILFFAVCVSDDLEARVVPVLGIDHLPVAGATPLSKRVFVTAAHVVDTNRSVLLLCDTVLLAARVKSVSETDDLALVELSQDCGAARPSRLAVDVALGSVLRVVGYPSRRFAAKVGFLRLYQDVHGYRGQVENMGVVDAETLPGNSGGPVLDENEQLVGIVVARLCFVSHEALEPKCGGAFIPATTVKKFAQME